MANDWKQGITDDLTKLKKRQSSLKNELDSINRQIRAYETALSVSKSSRATAPAKKNGKYTDSLFPEKRSGVPSPLRNAIEKIVEAKPKFRLKDLTTILDEQKLSYTETGVWYALKTLKEMGRLKKHGYGEYEYIK